MPSERIQRRIDALLDEADAAISEGAWPAVAEKARAVLAIDPANEDATAFLAMADANAGAAPATRRTAVSVEQPARSVIEAAAIVERMESGGDTSEATPTAEEEPESFAGGRYRVLRFLGEGGKKRVFLAHDALLDRDVAFSLIKTEGLDDVGRERITREAQAMGRLTHQHIVSVYDIGEHTAADGTKQPYLVQELMGGGDVEDLLADAEGPLPLARALEIALATARGLEFAHAQGVVHRDLKPGNVWLTADGVAKIGDLGLAVTLGQTRLTEHGMMVGTYGYMPPEQALGDEITPQADLYSLGAMLYELVTGRTPFQGDTPTAVISQHLNTQPVAPSWHSDHCPPDLEELILHLLAKAPADRPTSASEVIAALEAVDPEGVSASHSDSGANPLDRLARGIFVGRQDELDQLRTALDSALEGRGGVAMLVGDPGIGKTRTVQELETYARMRGANVYWGRTHESAGMPAYWPWLQVGRAWGAQQDFTTAATVSAVTNPELVRLFPELRQQIPSLPEPPEHRDPESAQFLLFDAYTQFVRAQSAGTPWVIVLDDLHWADKPTLQLLRFIARELANMNVLIVGTYRDTDLVRTHPLSETLAELNREGGFRRVVLKGLDPDEAASYVRQRAAVEPPQALLNRIYEETEGNPFFLSEVVNLLVEEGSLATGADTDSDSNIALPDGVREALGRRLDRLSEEANTLLQTAAVIGREFAYETLTLLDEDTSDDTLLALIEEALRARVIEESDRPGRYRFTHALMQETLLDELTTTRRVQMNGTVAEALERVYGDLAADRAPLLARYYLESSTLNRGHASKARSFSEIAARQSERTSAWSEAARHWQNAVAAAESEDAPTNELFADLLSSAGRAIRIEGGNVRAGWRSLLRAREIYRELGLSKGVADATQEAAQFLVPPERLLPLIEEALELLPRDATEQRAVLLAMRYRTSLGIAAYDEHREAWYTEGRRIADQTGSKRAHAHLLLARGQEFAAISADPQSVELLEQAHEALVEVGELELGAFALMALGNFHRFVGDLDSAVDAFSRGAAFSDDLRAAAPARGFHYFLGDIALARGEIEATRSHIDALLRLPGDDSYAKRLRSAIAEEAGELEKALAILEESTMDQREIMLAVAAGLRARVAFENGDIERAKAEIEAWGWTASPSWLGDALPGLLDDSELERAFRAGEASSGKCFVAEYGEGQTYDVDFDRLMGVLALRLGRSDEALRRLTDAKAWCAEQRLPVPLGRCHQALAEIEERRDNLEAAREHLDTAGELFARHGAKLYLDQVIAKKEILKA